MRAKFAAMTQEMPLALMATGACSRAAAEVYARDHDVAVFDAVDEVLVDVLHAVGGELLVTLGVQIARGDDDVRIDVIPILMDNAVCIHLFMTSSG